MTDFASSALDPQTGISSFYFAVGFIFGLMVTVLIIGSVIGMWPRPVPRVYAAIMEALAIVLLVSSGLCLSAYIWEIWVAFFQTNPFERHAFSSTHSGFGWIFYGLQISSAFAPQLFWLRRFRRSFPAVLLIAISASLGLWLERLVILITTSSQDFLPASW